VRESRTPGSVRGDRGNSVPYRVRIKPGVEGKGSVRNDPAAERNFVSSVQRAAWHHVGELAHGLGDTLWINRRDLRFSERFGSVHDPIGVQFVDGGLRQTEHMRENVGRIIANRWRAAPDPSGG
jgi:hypothetical protein